MIAFKVRLNYQPLTVAGAEEMSVLSAHVTGSFSAGRPDLSTLDLHVGGLLRGRGEEESEHVRWIPNRKLAVGDFITIEIVEASEVSPVVERSPRERSASIPDGENVIVLFQQEFLLLLQASHSDGLDPDPDDRNLAFRTNKLLQLGLLVPEGDCLIASELGRRFLDNNQSRHEFVHRYCVSEANS